MRRDDWVSPFFNSPNKHSLLTPKLMCGIAGGIDLEEMSLQDMLHRLHHRGPDQLGLSLSGSHALGISRLAILDLAGGQQPFRSTCGQVTAVCNGEIYNWIELRKTLESLGHRFHTRCDCEILPAAWLQWGEALPTKLNGMFAFAISDTRDGSLFLARDRCGQKPLYLTEVGAPLRFASEVKAFAALGHPLAPDPRHLATWLSLRYLPEPDTLFAGIRTLPAAHWLRLSPDGAETLQRYWQAPISSPTPCEPHLDSTLDELDQLTRSSVSLALQADVPLAAYLSAGVDSSLLVHYARELGADLTTTSISFAASSDEGAEATAYAHSLGLDHQATTLTPDSFRDLPRVIRQMDRPIGDALILAFDHLAAHTRSLGCKVALGGEGPDEYFAGYSFQRTLRTAERLGPVGCRGAAATLALVPPSLLDLASGFPASLGRSGKAKALHYLRHFSQKSPFQKATDLHTLFSPSEIAALLPPELAASQKALTQFDDPLSADSFQNALALQYRHWLPDWSLIRQDKNTMAHSLEYRSPFLDHRLIDFASALPTHLKLRRRSDKHLWRQLAARHLPASITHRPKQPFYLPLEQPLWRQAFLAYARQILTPESVASHGWLRFTAIEPLFQATDFLPLKQLAALVILQLWLEQHTASA